MLDFASLFKTKLKVRVPEFGSGRVGLVGRWLSIAVDMVELAETHSTLCTWSLCIDLV